MASWLKRLVGGPGKEAGHAPAPMPASASASRAAETPPGESVADLKRRGNAALDGGDLHGAVAAFRSASALAPGDAGVFTNLGFALLELGVVPGARGAFQTAMELAPALADAPYFLARIAAAQGDAGEAVVLYRKALALRPGFDAASLELGGLLATRGDAQGAIEVWREGLALDAGHVALTGSLAGFLASLGRNAEALALFRRLLELAPDDMAARLEAGRLAAEESIARHFSALAWPARPADEVAGAQTGVSCKLLLVEGWRTINHSFALINQFQMLELLRRPDVRLLHRDVPFPFRNWDEKTVGAGFPPADRARIDAVPAPSDGEEPDCIYRICSPFRAPGPSTGACRTISYLITEYGLVNENFAPGSETSRTFDQGRNLIVTSSRWSRDRLVEHGFSHERVKVVSCGVSRAIFHPLAPHERQARRAQLGFGDGETVFLNLGAAFWNKGVDVLIRAFATLRQRHPGIRLVLKDQRALYNVTTVEATLRALASELPGLFTRDTLDAITLVGSNLDPRQLRLVYGVADCYVSPYRAEGFNLPVLEALACGLPVVVTEGGSTDDFCPPEVAVRVPSRPGTRAGAAGHVPARYLEPDLDAVIEAMSAVVQRRVPGGPARQQALEALLAQKSWSAAAGALRALMD